MRFLVVTVFAFAAAAAATPVIRLLAVRFGILDRPDAARKIHGRAVPLMGGVAVFVAIVAGIAAAVAFGWLPGTFIKEKFLVGFGIAALLLVVGGALDDRYDLPPAKQIIWPLLASFVIVASGIGIRYVTSPFGGQFFLDRYVFTVLWWQGLPYRFTVFADLFTVAWLMGMTYTTKLLDGLDGLVAGLTAIGAFIVAMVAMLKEVSQPDTAVLALVVAGAFLGFLLYNFHPARIFLGEGGSTLAGFLLGTLAIIAGGKIATTLLVLGLPLFDAALVIVRRVFVERRSFAVADRSHLHFRLLDIGLSQRQVVLFYYFAAVLFGTSTLILSGWEKVVALGATLSVLVGATATAIVVVRKRATKNV